MNWILFLQIAMLIAWTAFVAACYHSAVNPPIDR